MRFFSWGYGAGRNSFGGRDTTDGFRHGVRRYEAQVNGCPVR